MQGVGQGGRHGRGVDGEDGGGCPGPAPAPAPAAAQLPSSMTMSLPPSLLLPAPVTLSKSCDSLAQVAKIFKITCSLKINSGCRYCVQMHVSPNIEKIITKLR